MSILTIRAVFENGVFRPLEKVELPEHGQFEFEPRPLPLRGDETDMNSIYRIMSRRHASGHPDTAANHDDHQP